MKILYLTDQTYLHGGVEKVLSQKANYLAEVSGDEVTVVTYNQKGRRPVYAFSEKIQFIDLGVNYEIAKSYFHPANLKKIPEHRKALSKVIKRLEPDVMVSCSYGPDFYFLPYLRRSVPKIKEFHSSRYFDRNVKGSWKDRLLKIGNAAMEKQYDQIVVLNKDEKPFYATDKVSIIPNPVEPSSLRVTNNAKKILAAGRISPVKNFSELIDIFAAVHTEFPDWELHFWGEDYVGTQGKLMIQIENYGLADRIKFMGTTTDLKKEMLNYSIYAMTSEMECFPMVLLEALSVGLPVISYDAPTGPKHILTPGSDSCMIPYKNSAIFVTQLKQLMGDEGLRIRMGVNARVNSHRFEIAAVMSQWRSLFSSLMKSSEHH